MTRSRTIAVIAMGAVVVALIAIGVQFIAHGNSGRPDLGRSIVVDPSKVTPGASHPSPADPNQPSHATPTTPTTPGATPVAPPTPGTGDDDPDGVDLDDLDETGSGSGADD